MAGDIAGVWSTGLFSCFEDCGVCCSGLLCLPCLYGCNAASVQNSQCCPACCKFSLCCCFVCWVGRAFRAELRAKYNLPEEPCSDFFVHLCCACCAVCQEAREIKNRSNAP